MQYFAIGIVCPSEIDKFISGVGFHTFCKMPFSFLQQFVTIINEIRQCRLHIKFGVVVYMF